MKLDPQQSKPIGVYCVLLFRKCSNESPPPHLCIFHSCKEQRHCGNFSPGDGCIVKIDNFEISYFKCILVIMNTTIPITGQNGVHLVREISSWYSQLLCIGLVKTSCRHAGNHPQHNQHHVYHHYLNI